MREVTERPIINTYGGKPGGRRESERERPARADSGGKM